MANPIIDGGYASALSIYETTTDRSRVPAVGTRGRLGERAFYLASMSNSTGIVSNNLAQSAAPIGNHVTETGTITYVAGSSRVTAVLGATAALLNEYEEGYVYIQSSTLGLGQMRRIKGGHAAVGSGGTITVDLLDPINITPTGTVTWTFIHNPWAHTIIKPVTDISGMVCGVPQVVVPAASATTDPVYFWCQTWGPASVLGDTTDTVLGHEVGSGAVGAGVAGSVGVAVASDIVGRVGISLGTLGTNTVYQSVFLTICP